MGRSNSHHVGFALGCQTSKCQDEEKNEIPGEQG